MVIFARQSVLRNCTWRIRNEERTFTGEQIVHVLCQVAAGIPVAEIIRKTGIGEQTFYFRKKKSGALGMPESRRLRQLEEENQKLKQLVADLSLDKAIPQVVISKKL